MQSLLKKELGSFDAIMLFFKGTDTRYFAMISKVLEPDNFIL